MGEMILVSGPSGSGKSRFAEGLAEKIPGRRYYIATMEPQTEENLRRIQKHREQRAVLCFTTLEIPYLVGKAEISVGSTVLLEDVSNLLANAVFKHRKTSEDVYQDILALAERSGVFIAVTISGLRPDGYEGETAAYIDALNRLNQRLFEQSAAAVEMKEGIPKWKKGDIDEMAGIPRCGTVHLQRDPHAPI